MFDPNIIMYRTNKNGDKWTSEARSDERMRYQIHHSCLSLIETPTWFQLKNNYTHAYSYLLTVETLMEGEFKGNKHVTLCRNNYQKLQVWNWRHERKFKEKNNFDCRGWKQEAVTTKRSFKIDRWTKQPLTIFERPQTSCCHLSLPRCLWPPSAPNTLRAPLTICLYLRKLEDIPDRRVKADPIAKIDKETV